MYNILLYLTFLSGMLPFILYVTLKCTTGVCKKVKPALPFLLLTAIGSLYEPIFTLALHIDSNYWFKTYNVLEFSCLVYLYYNLLGRKYWGLFLIFILIFTIVTIKIILFQTSQLAIESFYAPFIFLFVITCSSLWLRKVFADQTLPQLSKNPFIFFVLAFIFYYTTTLLFYLLSEVILVDKKIMSYQNYWLVNIIMTLIFKIILTKGVWNWRKT